MSKNSVNTSDTSGDPSGVGTMSMLMRGTSSCPGSFALKANKSWPQIGANLWGGAVDFIFTRREPVVISAASNLAGGGGDETRSLNCSDVIVNGLNAMQKSRAKQSAPQSQSSLQASQGPNSSAAGADRDGSGRERERKQNDLSGPADLLGANIDVVRLAAVRGDQLGPVSEFALECFMRAREGNGIAHREWRRPLRRPDGARKREPGSSNKSHVQQSN